MLPLGELESEYLWLDKTCEAIRQEVLGKIPLDYGKFLMRSLPNSPFYREEEKSWISTISKFHTASVFDLQLMARARTIDTCVGYADVLRARFIERDYGLSETAMELLQRCRAQLETIRDTLYREIRPQYIVATRYM